MILYTVTHSPEIGGYALRREGVVVCVFAEESRAIGWATRLNQTKGVPLG